MAHRLAPQARADLDDIWEYIASESGDVAAADRLIDTIISRFLLLASWPRLGRTRDDLRRVLRSFPVGAYIIFYRLQRRDVLVLRVLHARRDMPQILARE